jgi:hypothetical protein
MGGLVAKKMLLQVTLDTSCKFGCQVQSRLVPSGPVWSRLVPSGPVWSRLVPSGPVWSRLVPSSPVRSSPVTYILSSVEP